MSQKDPLKERISLLEMGEAQGKLKPEHKAELEKYRASGMAKPLPSADGSPSQSLETAKSRDDARKALAVIGRVSPILDRVEQLQRSAMSGRGLAGLKEYLPFRQENQQYDAATAMLKTAVRPVTRTPGEGATSDFESKLATQIVPNRWNFDGTNEEAIRGLRTFLNTSRDQYTKQLGGTLPKPPPGRPSAAAQPAGWTITRKK
ncbi:hypothetical protein ABIC65_003342 [Sphingomonas trueperi]|uniref:hypothetical protein n=1 Tax=Sphingomonas trueperi TaxID=53317 RepID=UPI0033943D57